MHWGEPLNQIKQEYRMKLLGYSYGMARYWVLIPDAQGVSRVLCKSIQ